MTRTIFLVFLVILITFPFVAYGEPTSCETEQLNNGPPKEALKYKLISIVTILFASSIGVVIPVLGKFIPALSPEQNFFYLIKAFAAGVILSTGMIHVLPDAFDNLTSPCISAKPWGEFPFAGFIAMVAAIGTLMVDTYAMSYYNRKAGEINTQVNSVEEGQVPVHNHAHGLVSTSALESDSSETELRRHRVISKVLELGIVVHSVIIGIALGASQSPETIKPLIVALSFHQFFEGIGLGGCITQAKFKSLGVTIMALFFSLTTPIGIGIGIGISKIYSETSPTALIVEGVFNSASAGILIYMALVDLLAADFMSPKLQKNGKLQLGANATLLLGAGCMSLLAKWA